MSAFMAFLGIAKIVNNDGNTGVRRTNQYNKTGGYKNKQVFIYGMYVMYISRLCVFLCEGEMNGQIFVQMSCTQEAVISPCLSEAESWKTNCSHQPISSEFFFSDLHLLGPILEVGNRLC